MSEGVVVTITPARLPADPGASAQVTLRLQNNTAVVDEYTVEVLGEAAAYRAE